MKRFFGIFLALVLTLTACLGIFMLLEPRLRVGRTPDPDIVEDEPEPAPPAPFAGKIVIISNSSADISGTEQYYAAAQAAQEYGADKITHLTWPENYMREQEEMVNILAGVAEDPSVKALIINQAVFGALAALAKLRETRDDIFVVYCLPQEDPVEIAQLADLILDADTVAMGSAMVEQAYKMGAKTFVHYSFPRQMLMPVLAARRDEIALKCAQLGLEFLDGRAPDPMSDVDAAAAAEWPQEDITQKIAEYGKDIAFFATECGQQAPLIMAVAQSGAIFPQPCHPSPYHGFPVALGLIAEDATPYVDSWFELYKTDINAQIRKALDKEGALGRFSNWPVPIGMLCTWAGVEYALKRLNGEASPDSVDQALLEQCLADYAGVACTVRPYVEGVTYYNSIDPAAKGTTYPNFLLVREDYLIYE